MELRDLKAFMSVVEHGSYTKAAQKSYISQPSLSKCIKKLEERLHVELLDRSTRHVLLTDAGKIVYEQGKKLQQILCETEVLLEDLTNVQAGHLKIGMPPLIGRMFFPKLAREFRALYPDVQLELTEYGAKLIGTMVEHQEVDVGFIVLPTDAQKYDVYPFVEEPFCLYVHKDHPLAQKRQVRVRELQDELFILFSEEFSLHDLVMKSCRRAGFTPKVSFKSSQWDLMLELVAAQLGIALLPQAIQQKQSTPDVVCIPLIDDQLYWRIGIITKKGAYQSYALQKFLQLLQ